MIAGCAAHAEDNWSAITAGNITIKLAKPCSRCAIPSLHPTTAERHPMLLRALAGYRRRDGKVYFGQNGLHQQQGIIETGQAVSVQEQ